ncbi:unnamed protein product [Spirodela intermedia]|uniref:NAD(P)H dehydrogenase subunit H n=1 Tax=Spirodela intermedia TaxID=51605 RepID=A0A7I8J8V3_SPIIN|nr:unnamed protein product [Spirodela intermedia]CAA6666470.1 unnamed protein product [Spirodela intermedia]
MTTRNGQIKTFTSNSGPQHPAAHGVSRSVLEMNGEVVERAEPHIGLLQCGTKPLTQLDHPPELLTKLLKPSSLRRRTLRELMARPSISRTTSRPTTSIAKSRSRTWDKFLCQIASRVGTGLEENKA